ncbi:hypothetical protein JW835_01065 [bacterium]|nr:hypothetical protein [bacterium]
MTDRCIIKLSIGVLFIIAFSAVPNDHDIVLLKDDFSQLRRGPLSNSYGARTEYHYFPEAAPRGGWAVSNDRGWWSVRESENDRYIYQKKLDELDYAHPMIITGDVLWTNVHITVSFAPESFEQLCGIAFRYQNDRCYYFFGVKDNKVMLKKVQHGIGFHQPFEAILAQDIYNWKIGETLLADIKVDGTSIQARINEKIVLQAVDSTFRTGKIGFLSDVPARFTHVLVTAPPSDYKEYKRNRMLMQSEETRLQNENPKPVIWKKISTEGFGVGRNLRFGDMDGDGVMDVLIGQVNHHGPKDRNSELSCLTAMTFDGRQLWQIGQPDPWKDYLTNDVAFQIHDLDRDGQNEVIYCKNFKLIVADGATGQIEKKIFTPETPGGKPYRSVYNIFPHILGDCLYLCDLRGVGYDSDIIFKDRYRYLWAYNDQLELLWNAECNTGHYPYAVDMDGDGRDELMMGYTLFDDNGEKLWSLDDTLQDHADGVAILSFRPGADLRLLCAASDEGLFFTDKNGRILKHYYIGHVQNPAIANFRDDLPGLEVVTINFWRNQGIIHFFDADGNLYHSFEPNQYGSMCLPVNWTGRTEEFFIHNANIDEGGMYDGWGRKVVVFPDDGHPDMCNAVVDIIGDCRDEVIVWDPHEIWVYTQDDNPKPQKLYDPLKNPLYNESNYKASVSIP